MIFYFQTCQENFGLICDDCNVRNKDIALSLDKNSLVYQIFCKSRGGKDDGICLKRCIVAVTAPISFAMESKKRDLEK